MLSGFLSPECKWYECCYAGHSSYAYELLDAIDPKLRRGGNGTDMLISLGWLHISEGLVMGLYNVDTRPPNEAQTQWLWDRLEHLSPSQVDWLKRQA